MAVKVGARQFYTSTRRAISTPLSPMRRDGKDASVRTRLAMNQARIGRHRVNSYVLTAICVSLQRDDGGGGMSKGSPVFV